MTLTAVDFAQNIGHILRHIANIGKISENSVMCLKIKHFRRFSDLVGTCPQSGFSVVLRLSTGCFFIENHHF
jgi:hypothetical protein